jgi:hypothetical protein
MNALCSLGLLLALVMWLRIVILMTGGANVL